MSRILLAWELGGNYGHLAKLLPLAQALKEKGHKVAVAVKDLATAGQVFERSDFILLQAPLDAQQKPSRHPVSFAGILKNYGFGSLERLDGLVQGWHSLFKLFQADVVVSEYAPTAVLSAQLTGIPCLRFDTGFGIPPEVSPWPCFRPWMKIGREQLFKQENEMLAIVNRLCGAYARPSYHHLFEAVRADLNLLTTLPELDHYAGRRGGRYIGPLSQLNGGQDVAWPVGNGPKIFAYLRPFPGLRNVLEGLEACNCQAVVVVPGIDPALHDRFTGSSLSLSCQPVALSPLLAEADLVISHASHGLSSAALLAGVPTLAVPTQIEQMLLAKTMERLGIGVSLSASALKNGCAETIRKIATDRIIRSQTRSLAGKYASYDEQATITRLATTIERLPAATNQRR